MNNKSLIFFKRKKVLITGHTGFKGAWLCIMLNNLGAKIYGISLKPEKNSLFQKAKIFNIIKKSIICDINDKKSLKKNLDKIKPNIIIHLAAQSLVIKGYENPSLTYKTNLMGTLNVLECSKKIKNLKKILIVTTDKVYDVTQKKLFKEDDKMFGRDPYSASKVCVEHLVYSHKHSYFDNLKKSLDILIGRSGNVIGGGDIGKYRIVPDLTRAIKHQKILYIRNPNSIRPWQHVLEPLYGYLLLISAKNIKKSNYAWNFGPDKKSFRKVIEIVKKFKANFVVKCKIKKNNYKETKILKLNSIMAKKKLGWKSKWDFNETLNKIIEFEKLAKLKVSYYDICLKQINEYLKK